VCCNFVHPMSTIKMIANASARPDSSFTSLRRSATLVPERHVGREGLGAAVHHQLGEDEAPLVFAGIGGLRAEGVHGLLIVATILEF
jgi:hypothetical protein